MTAQKYGSNQKKILENSDVIFCEGSRLIENRLIDEYKELFVGCQLLRRNEHISEFIFQEAPEGSTRGQKCISKSRSRRFTFITVIISAPLQQIAQT